MSRAVAPAALLMVLTVTGCSSQPETEMTLGERALADLSEVEREVLSDKRVSQAELERATEIFRECVTTNGMTYDEDETRQGPSSLAVTIDPLDDEDLAYRESALGDCIAEVNAIEEVWVLQNEATPEQRAAAQVAFVDCLTELDVVPDQTSFEEAAEEFAYAAQSEAPVSADGTPSPLQQCAIDLTESSGTTALPGLAEALAALDVDAR